MKKLAAFIAGVIFASGLWYCVYYDATHISENEMLEWTQQ